MYLRSGELIVSEATLLIGRGELSHINELIEEYDEIGLLIQVGKSKHIVEELPISIREKVSRMIDTELRAREAEIKATLQNQFQVKV